MKKWDSYETSIANLEKSFSKKCKKEYVNLLDAHGRILAEDIVAKENCPKSPTSSMDGYAIRYEDQELSRLKITSFVPAGSETSLEVKNGECIKTFTGSLMSDGADTLIPIENVEVVENEIIIKEKVSLGFAVRPKGEAYKKDDVLVTKGTRIGYAEVSMLAELGIFQIGVYIPPRVGILATGDEIVDLGESLTRPSQIRSSNHVGVACIAKEVGAEPVLLGIAKDNKDFIKQRILDGLETCDIVVTTGGVSVGDYDFVKEVVKEMGVESIVDGAAIKPGRHIKIVKVGEKYIIGLPGFPYSSLVGFYLYGVRLIEHWLDVDFNRRLAKAVLDEDYQKRSRLAEFTACNLHVKNSQLHVDLDGKIKGSSAIINNMLKDAVLLCVKEDKKCVKKGEEVDIVRLKI